MDRRKVLHALGVGVAGVGLAGCNTGDDDPTATGTDTPTASPTLDPASAPTASALDGWHFDRLGTVSQQIDPEVSYRSGTNTVIVEGAERAGSNDCRRVALGPLEYWDGTLRVTITSAPTDNPETETGCDTDIAYGSYRLAMTFSDGLPAQVLVTTSQRDQSHTFERFE